MEKLQTDVDNLIEKRIKSNEFELKHARIMPFKEDYPFFSNGIYFFAGKMGSGKTHNVIKHLLLTERMFSRPYYDLIIYSSTSGKLDKTVEALKQDVNSEITFVSDKDLMGFLKKHIKQKEKFYAMCKFILYEKPNEIINKIVAKHKFYDIQKGEKTIHLSKLFSYMISKISDYGFKTYPSMTLLILDDFAGHPLLKSVDSPLNLLLTKTRHYNLTAILMVQSWRFIHLNFKRLCTDIVIFKGFSELDFRTMIEQTPNSVDWKELWDQYKNLPSEHSYMTLHINAGKITFDE
jgi:hypothetical protein